MLVSKESDLLQINDVLINAEWLRNNLGAPNLRVIDASTFMPGSPRNGEQEWATKRIPGAVYFDFDKKIVDKSSSVPHTLPTPAHFEACVSELGIKNTDALVVYDSAGIFSAPRVWWMFKIMGHQSVAVLDGGLPAWESIGGSLDTKAPAVPESTVYKANFQPERVIDKTALLAGIESSSLNVIDVRPSDRFSGRVTEPRAGVRSGHMPNAKNLPFGALLENGKYKNKAQLQTILNSVLSSDLPNVSSCGSGVTACILTLASEFALNVPVIVYDGSWTEWGSDASLPIVSDSH
ncbi:sulfurtransferase [Enterovibrio sp. 27052020O]|uniref:sulfurtransferase n=1 Tax=Enterovibrio sp. 27052020O TaxID=3241166 RepID=UPI003890E0B1